MQNDNKLAIGGAGGNQQRQQENNFRIGRLVRPPVRTEIRRPNRTLQPSTNASAASLQRNEAAGNRSSLRMSYLPSETAYRTIRADERDDSHIPVGRAGEIVQWNHNHGRARNDSAFATLSYRREQQMASYRMPESWRQVPEREWRRPIPSGVLRETASVATENLQMQQGPRSQGSWNTSALSNSPDAFRLSSSWSQGNFPTVAEINRHNKLQQARSSRGGIHVQTGAADDVQAISMSSSNGSSTTSPPHNAAVGNKRLNDAVAPPDPTKPTPLAPTIPSAFTSTNQKKQKISPPTKKAGFDMLNLLCSATLEVGPLQDNPSGCSCPKSKCVALYCDCFKAGRRCDKGTCSCLDCKNTVEESGKNL